MNYGFFEVLNLIGSLAFFIYGMKIMSEAIQKVAGSKMRQILSSMTSNRFKGVFTGFAITSLIQSSSATTVLVVSFVNAGLLSLVESIGVIMGANIGTTITAWLISIIGFKVKIAAIALPLIGLSFPLLFFSKDKIKSWGEVLIGFALLFMGLEFLKDSVPDLKANPELLQFFAQYTDMGIWSNILFVFIGTLFTVVVQSSSAAMAVTLVMANNGWIPFDIAASMVLGENIGTTITANLAAIVANVHAKRAAFAHFIFNVFGVTWIILILHPYLSLITAYLTTDSGSSPVNDPHAIPIALSIFHTTFNILNTLILVWFVPQIAKLVTRTIKASGDDEDFKLEYISTGLLNTAELSLKEAQKEVIVFGRTVKKMSGTMQDLLEEKDVKKQKRLMKKLQKQENNIDQFEEEITKYLAKVTDGKLSSVASQNVVSLLTIVTDMERVGDVYFQISKDIENRADTMPLLSKKQKANILEMAGLVDKSLDVMIQNLAMDFPSVTMKEALKAEEAINQFRDKLRKEHVKEMEEKNYKFKVGSLYKDIFQSLEKIGDHVMNVTEAITGESERDARKAEK